MPIVRTLQNYPTICPLSLPFSVQFNSPITANRAINTTGILQENRHPSVQISHFLLCSLFAQQAASLFTEWAVNWTQAACSRESLNNAALWLPFDPYLSRSARLQRNQECSAKAKPRSHDFLFSSLMCHFTCLLVKPKFQKLKVIVALHINNNYSKLTLSLPP